MKNLIGLKKGNLYVVEGEVQVYLGSHEQNSRGQYIYLFRSADGREHWIGVYPDTTFVEVGTGRKPKLRTLKAVRAEQDELRKIAETQGYKFVNEADGAKWDSLRKEIEVIKLVRAQRAERKASKNTGYETIYQEARETGLKAGKEAIPTPMVVQEHANQLNDNSAVKKEWYVSEGACGFAWVNVKDRKFGLWLKAKGYGDHDSYYGGFTIWVGDFNQSITRKEAYAGAFASVLKKNGIDCYSNSRLD